MDHIFESITTRKYTVGTCTIYFLDNGNVRKAWLEIKGKQMVKWQESDNERWLASALYHFVTRLKKRTFSKEDTYCVFACIGRALESRNVGRYWQEYHNPGTVSYAISEAQSRCGLVFRLAPVKTRTVSGSKFNNPDQPRGNKGEANPSLQLH
ncbi:hypothetical protein PHOBOS_94 [Erwinia phage vB_EamM_Phobos]|uniref:hypothetical protein n=1 Tax=Erwinia phage vB_EamM_Phobos TaxID=1883377 RepID=UPI00081D32AB|nr:hypothetical protein BIZ79_gp094 [Erwinia phage vB_EamM_Phobos]ANZ50284.1 hypothetical protein PHOBOS_94 [Erwinia phage vB_EamM_Phobos]